MSAEKETYYSDDMLTHYMGQIRDNEILSKDQINELFHRYQTGDMKAKDKIIEANLRYVVKAAHKYTNDQDLVLDLISEGNIGIMRAIEKFDPSLGFSFLTYADRWVRYQIEYYLTENSKPVDVPINVMKLARKIYKAQEKLIAEKGSAAIADIMEATGEDEETVQQMVRINQSSVSMDSFVSHDQDAGATIGDFMPDEGCDPSRDSELSSSKAWLMSKIEKLPPQTRDALIHHFGLLGNQEKTLAEIGRIKEVSREYIRQQVLHGLTRLKQMADKDGIDLGMLASDE